MKLRVTQAARTDQVEADQVEAWSGLHWVRFQDIAARLPGAPAAGDMIAALRLIQDHGPALADLAAQAEPAAAGRAVVMPFRPAAYRDFLLYERHAIDATRGYCQRFAPDIHATGVASEQATGQTYEGFLPRPAFYRRPNYYMSNPHNFVASGETIEWPDFTEALDYELELGVILTRPLYKASAEAVRRAIGGVVVFNDCSARDVQLDEMNSGFGPQRSKNFANAIANEVVSFDAVAGRLEALSGAVRINGREVARCSSAGPQFALPEAISILSQSERLHAGEMFGSGTWPGGSGMENGAWLAPGDTLTLAIDGVGEVTNRIGARGQAIWATTAREVEQV